MPATPKSTPKKQPASANGTPAASPSTTSTPSRMTRAQARATGTKIRTPSPIKKRSLTPSKASAKKAAPAAVAVDAEESTSRSPSPSKSKSKTPTKAGTSSKSTPKSSPKKSPSPAKATASPRKVPASHAKLTRKPTSALATAQPIVAEYSEEEDEDEDKDEAAVEEQDEDDEDEDEDEDESDLEEGQDVSEKGMQRLMAALGEDGLDEVDMAALDELAGNEDEEDEDDEEQDEDDEEDEELEAAEEGDNEEQPEDDDIPRVKPNANGDTLAASIARSGLVEAIASDDEEQQNEEAEEDSEEEDEETAIAYEDLPDDVELSEQAKASRVQRIKVNNEPALRRIYEDIRLDSPSSSSKLPWIETMRVSYPTSVSTEVSDVENDLERELAFYKQALHAAVEGKKLVEASGTPFTRPSDYFAEMVKTDEHMERIRQKLLDESAAIKASEAAKKQRELKKFGKKVQVEKLQERIRNKKEMNARVQGLKRKHGSAMDDGGDGDDFDVRVEEAIGERPSKKPAQGKGGRDPTNKAKMPRSARDAKYGFGGKKKHAKSNTAESTNDFRVGPSRGARGTKPLKGKPTSGKAGFRPKQKSGAAKRPGKARRAGH